VAAGTRTIDLTDRQTVDKEPGAFRTISEVADELDVPQHVLRFWETRFSQIRPLKRGGGRRFYRPDDVLLIRGVRHLLYGEGYTIKGVQRILKEEGVRFVQQVGSGEARSGDASGARVQESRVQEPRTQEQGADWDDGDWPGAGADDLPSIVRPRPYSSAHQDADVVASPPLADWQAASDFSGSPGSVNDPYAPPDYRRESYPPQGQAAGEGPRPHDPAAGQAPPPGAAFPYETPHETPPGPAPLARSTPAAAHEPDLWSDAPETSHASAPEGAGAAGVWDTPPNAVSGGPGFAYARPALAASQRARLQEALAELLECRRLLAHARGELDNAD